MTDRTGPAPPWSDNIRAEIARRRTTAREVREAMRECVRPGRSAWRERMRRPELWRMAELQEVADVLGIELAELTERRTG